MLARRRMFGLGVLQSFRGQFPFTFWKTTSSVSSKQLGNFGKLLDKRSAHLGGTEFIIKLFGDPEVALIIATQTFSKLQNFPKSWKFIPKKR